MKAAAVTYHAPRTVAEASALLESLDNARLLGGGQSLMPMLNLRVAAPDHLIDLGRVDGLVGIDADGDAITIGAMTTQRAVQRSELVRHHVPLLGQAVDHVGHQQTRNRGTLGGSICHLDPGAELPVAAAALDAVLVTHSSRGPRRIPFAEFPVDYLTNSLDKGEILIAIEFPKAGPRTGSAFHEFNLRPADFAIVSVAVQLSLDARDCVERIAIAIGGIQYAPVRLTESEDAMIGHPFTADILPALVAPLSALDVDGDDLYPPDFRREICEVLLQRATKEAYESARVSHG